MRIEILDGGAVINTIVADEAFAELHYPGAWRLSADQDEPAAPTLPQQLTRLAFRNRFTSAEKVALEIAALDDPAAAMPARQQAAAVRAYLADVAAATYIDLGREDLRSGVLALEAMGLLATGRALEILDTPIEPHERPQ